MPSFFVPSFLVPSFLVPSFLVPSFLVPRRLVAGTTMRWGHMLGFLVPRFFVSRSLVTGRAVRCSGSGTCSFAVGSPNVCRALRRRMSGTIRGFGSGGPLFPATPHETLGEVGFERRRVLEVQDNMGGRRGRAIPRVVSCRLDPRVGGIGGGRLLLLWRTPKVLAP
jgi:hypothetical protein